MLGESKYTLPVSILYIFFKFDCKTYVISLFSKNKYEALAVYCFSKDFFTCKWLLLALRIEKGLASVSLFFMPNQHHNVMQTA